jgi:3-methyladenine DNA glycosylase AlkD
MHEFIVDRVRQQLMEKGEEGVRDSARRFFKHPIKCYGVKAHDTETIAKSMFREIPEPSKEEIFSLCENFWKSGILEETIIACHWSYKVHKSYAEEDMNTFEKWIDTYVDNWATCDTFCKHNIGTLVDMYPALIRRLILWSERPNLWMRRAAAVSLIIPARRGKFLPEILKIAGILLTDKEEMVQKGYGWMLKVASHLHLNEVFAFVMRHKTEMPRTALRYAIEKMPLNLKKQAMAR